MKRNGRKLKAGIILSSLFLVGTLSLSACAGDKNKEEAPAPSPQTAVAQDDTEVSDEVESKESIWVPSTVHLKGIRKDINGEEVSQEYTLQNNYDEQGNKTSDIYVEGDNKVLTSYTYDEYGWILTSHNEYSEAENFDDTYVNTYDDQHRLVCYASSEVSCDYSYDDNGNRSQSKSTSTATDEDGNVQESFHVIIIYNEDGTIKSRAFGPSSLYEFAYEYDAEGKPIKCIETSYSLDESGQKIDDGSITSTSIYTYDENGNVVHVEHEGSYESHTTDYEYIRIDHPSLGAKTDAHLFIY